MATETFKCVKSTLSSKGGFVNTIVTEQRKSVEVFGQMKEEVTKRTYYIKTEKTIPLNKEAQLDLANFRIVERPYTFTDEETGEEKTIACKWLHL
jgi:hypothetical protein